MVVILRLVAGMLYRCEQEKPWMILELHPGGGQHHCLDVRETNSEGRPAKLLTRFKYDLLISFNSPNADTDFNYLEQAAHTSSFSESLAKALAHIGIPTNHAPTLNCTAFCFEFLAWLVKRFTLPKPRIEVACCWFDSSGEEGCSINRTLVGLFPKEEFDRLSAIRYWSIRVGNEETVLGLDGKLYVDGTPIDIYAEFLNCEKAKCEYFEDIVGYINVSYRQ